MLGYWNKAVYITYFGALAASIWYMLSLKYQNPSYAFTGMLIAAVCDLFDGKVARHDKKRSEEAKAFGVEIDSLADIICFIAIPALTIYSIGLNTWYQIAILALYITCGIIRLAYFNVAMSDKNNAIKVYKGLPVPVSVFVFGLIWMLYNKIGFSLTILKIIYMIIVPIVGFLHISRIKIKKFTSMSFYLFVCIIAFILICLLFIRL